MLEHFVDELGGLVVRELYTVSMFEGAIGPAGSHENITVPPGYRWVIRDIIANPQGSSVSSNPTPVAAGDLNIITGYLTDTIFYWRSPAVFVGGMWHWSGRQAFDENTELTLITLGATGWFAKISGYQLSLP